MQMIDTLKEHLSKIVLQYGHHAGKTGDEAAYFFIGPPEEVAPGVHLIYSLANSVTFVCRDRLMQVDCNIGFKAPEVIRAIREHTTLPFDTLVISHGHVDHCMGAYHYIRDAAERGDPRPRIIGHRNLRKRIDKNRMLEGHRIGTDKKQFQVDFEQKDLFVYPDVEFEDRLDVTVGGELFWIVFGHGHTEDSIWVHCPDRKVLCCGDLFQWTAPNVGNPFKMQRFARENAAALEEMAACGAEVLCPGHGPVVRGRTEIETCLHTAARYLRHIEDHVVGCLNRGMLLEETVRSLSMPDELHRSKWLPPVYGHPAFIAQGIYRRYAGYYTGNPAELFPPAYAEKSGEVLLLAGGADAVLGRARALRAEGKIELACQLAEWVVTGAPGNRAGWETYGSLFMERAGKEINMQARGCWNSAVRKAVSALERIDEEEGENP